MPTLAGRNAGRMKELADARGWPHIVIGLDNGEMLAAALRDFAAVLHCAGPFSTTSAPMRAACLASRTHYLDITGEIDVFVEAHAQHALAYDAGSDFMGWLCFCFRAKLSGCLKWGADDAGRTGRQSMRGAATRRPPPPTPAAQWRRPPRRSSHH
jgi:hypothetical protein